MNKGGRWVEGSIHNAREVIQTNSDVFWPNKLTCDILDHDEQNSVESH